MSSAKDESLEPAVPPDTLWSDPSSPKNEPKEESNTGTVRAPSHILHDGAFVHLPEPFDRFRFFERTVAKYGLIQEDLAPSSTEATHSAENEDGNGTSMAAKSKDESKDKEEKQTLHPLALASGSLQNNGISVLNSIINLSSLVSEGQYFTLTNVVDPSVDVTAAAAMEGERGKAGIIGEGGIDSQEELRLKSLYTLRVKCGSFRDASTRLERQKRHLEASIVAQAQPDKRLRQLRKEWKLVAPEHGTRASAHATRPTEVVAVDVDLYSHNSRGDTSLGRLARRVPRYATVELKKDYDVTSDVDSWRRKWLRPENAMEVEEDTREATSKANVGSSNVQAEPFMIADPTLGKLDTDFDPKKVDLFTLQMSIEKPECGFKQTHYLKPINLSSPENGCTQEESKLLRALQHSLFSAKLFESIRREIAPDTEEIGQLKTSAEASSVVWLSSVSSGNNLPPPFQMINTLTSQGQMPLCVIHCHESEVMVQLDCEYSLRIQLVRANDAVESSEENTSTESGSMSPIVLRALCRSLLLRAKECYHEYAEDLASQVSVTHQDEPVQSHGRTKKAVTEPATILRSTVSLGSKMLFERRIRSVLREVSTWAKEKSNGENLLSVEWLPLSVFDKESYFVITCRNFCWDAHISREILTLTSFEESTYRKVQFHSDFEFDIFLRNRIKQILRE